MSLGFYIMIYPRANKKENVNILLFQSLNRQINIFFGYKLIVEYFLKKKWVI